MTDERHQWKLTNPLAYGPGVKRVYTNVSPIKSVSAFSIDLGKTYHIDFDPATNIYINSIESYVELIAVSPVVVGYWPLAAALGLYNPVARITYDYGWTYDVAGDVFEAETPTQYSASYGNWDPLVDPTIYLDGVDVDPADYTLNTDDGTVTFAVAPSPGVEVSADYTYTAPAEVVDAIGLVTTAGLTTTRINQRGLAGLSSLRVAEVAMTTIQGQKGSVTRNGSTIPGDAADLLDGFVFGSAAA